jgi:hypothetical protein
MFLFSYVGFMADSKRMRLRAGSVLGLGVMLLSLVYGL